MHWCLGVFSSGSTWLYNAVRRCAETAFPGRTLETRFVYHAGSVPEAAPDRRTVIVKSHQTEEAAEEQLDQRAETIWISIRDPRDCVASMMRYSNASFEDAVELVAGSASACARFVADIRARVFRYEDGFIDDAETIRRISEGLGGPIAPQDRDRIFQELRRPAIERLISQLASLPTAVQDPGSGHAYDEQTHWHNHHANRTGEIGRWRHELTAEQVSSIETTLSGWMRRFGYGDSASGAALTADPGYALSDATKASLRHALASFDRSDSLIVVAATDRHSLLLDNWLCHMDALGLLRFLVVAMDDGLYNKLQKAGVAAVRCDFNGTLGDFWLRRMQVCEVLVRQGHDLIHSDTDAIWLRDPMPFFQANDGFDFLCSQGTLHPVEILDKWGFVLCAGLFRMKARKPAKRLLAAILTDPGQVRDIDDQAMINTVLADLGTVWARDTTESYAHSLHDITFSCYRTVLAGECPALGLRAGLLPHHLFPRLPTAADGPYIKHVLRPGDDIGRIEGLRAAGCWLMDHAMPKLAPYPAEGPAC